MADVEKRPRGRPIKAPGESIARPNLSLRLRRDLYDRLRAVAESDGRSLSEEIERRLEDSFALGSMQDRLAETVARAVAVALATRERCDPPLVRPSSISAPLPSRTTLVASPCQGGVGSVAFDG